MSLYLELDEVNLTTVKVMLPNGEDKTYDVMAELKIDTHDLNTEFEKHPAKYAWWASLAETAKHQRDVMASRLEKAEAEADYRARLEMDMEGIKVTETQVKHRIRKDEEYIQTNLIYLRHKKTGATLDKIVRAFDQRLDALISLGANMRNEKDSSNVTSLKKQARTVISDN